MKLWISFVPFYNDFNFFPIRQTYRYELEDMKYYITTFIVQKADLYLLEYEKVRVQSIRTHTYTILTFSYRIRNRLRNEFIIKTAKIQLPFCNGGSEG